MSKSEKLVIILAFFLIIIGIFLKDCLTGTAPGCISPTMTVDTIYIVSRGEIGADNIGIDIVLYRDDKVVSRLPYRWVACAVGVETELYTPGVKANRAVVTVRNVEYPATLYFYEDKGDLVYLDLKLQSTLDPGDPTYELEYDIGLMGK